MSAIMWFVIVALIIAGTVACAVLASLRYWVAFALFFAVWVIGVVAAAVQAVMES